jgi:hypothetical protein
MPITALSRSSWSFVSSPAKPGLRARFQVLFDMWARPAAYRMSSPLASAARA